MLRRRFLQLSAGAAFVPSARAAPRHFHDPNLHLFVDDREIQSYTNLLRVLNKPRKHPEPVIVADKPWEGERAQAWGSIIQEPDGLLRAWYFAFNTERAPNELDRGGYAYAESRDGIHWDKPALGMVEFRGSKQNNLFYTFAPDAKNLVDEELARRGIGLPALDESGRQIGILNNADGLTVVRDDDDPDPARRYKLVANMQDHRMWAPYYKDRYPNVSPAQVDQARSVMGQYIDTSPDGIRWTRRPRRLLAAKHGDYMTIARDIRNRRWWLNERPWALYGRNAGLRVSADLNHWPPVADPVFSNDAENGFGKTWEWHGGITPFNYGNMDIGLAEKWSNAGFGDRCELVCHRDGEPWRRVAPGQDYLEVGPEGAFDRILAFPTHNPPAVVGDRLHIYYTGGGTGTNPKRGMPMAIGLATVRLDRFAGLAHSRRDAGRLLTKPVTVATANLEVNTELLNNGRVRLALRYPDESVIPGYSADDSQIDVGQPVRTPARWKTKPDLRDLIGKPVVLDFEVTSAILYAYRFA